MIDSLMIGSQALVGLASSDGFSRRGPLGGRLAPLCSMRRAPKRGREHAFRWRRSKGGSRASSGSGSGLGNERHPNTPLPVTVIE